MSRICEITGKKPMTGHKVSNSNQKTKTRFFPNLNKKKYLLPELSRSITLQISAQGVRTIDKLGGIARALFQINEQTLSPRLLRVKRDLVRKRKPGNKKVA